MIKGFREVMPVAMVICDVKIIMYSVDIITYIGILQSRKTMVSRSDWLFSNSVVCGWKVQFVNDSPFRTVSKCGQLLIPGFGPSSFVCPFVSACPTSVSSNSERPCRIEVCSKRRFCRPGSWYFPSASCWTTLLGQAGNGTIRLADAPV